MDESTDFELILLREMALCLRTYSVTTKEDVRINLLARIESYAYVWEMYCSYKDGYGNE